MIAVVFPGSAVNEISLKTSSSLSGYLNETFLNSTSPFLFGFNFLGSLLSFIASSVSIISFIVIPAPINYIVGSLSAFFFAVSLVLIFFKPVDKDLKNVDGELTLINKKLINLLQIIVLLW